MSAGVKVPEAVDVDTPSAHHFPLVRKPVDGAGSLHVRRFDSLADWHTTCGAGDGHVVDGSHRKDGSDGRLWRLERFVPGWAVSVAALCGDAEPVYLPACRQRLSADGRFRYLGGALPIAADLDRRARRLAEAALAALPTARGYVGMDLILGPPPDGSEDVVVEVNPRLTTSYVGLREAVRGNLMRAMLDVVGGRGADLPMGYRPVQFEADGAVSWMG
jgi:predicted ATP-grasp superfamily ATP-dependent carboligase